MHLRWIGTERREESRHRRFAHPEPAEADRCDRDHLRRRPGEEPGAHRRLELDRGCERDVDADERCLHRHRDCETQHEAARMMREKRRRGNRAQREPRHPALRFPIAQSAIEHQ
jgi:hypothetical protein